MHHQHRATLTLCVLLVSTAAFIATRRDSQGLAGPGERAPRQTVVLPSGAAAEVPQHPVRVLPASTGLLDWLEPLIDPARLAAIPNLSEEYSLVTRSTRAAQFLARPRFAEFESESLLVHVPDLVLVQAWNAAATRERLVRVGVPVVELPIPGTWEDLVAGTRLLGALLDERALCATLLDEMEKRRAALEARRAGRAPRVLVYSNYNSGGVGSVTGGGTTMDLFVRLAGARNAAAGHGLAQFSDADLELLFQLDPDVLVISRDERGSSTTRDYIHATRALDELRAVRDDHVVELDSRLMEAASHYVLDAAESLASELDRLGL
ncbi:MAG: ABC transporter substrate-binding protein [Planctomycetota bacterium]